MFQTKVEQKYKGVRKVEKRQLKPDNVIINPNKPKTKGKKDKFYFKRFLNKIYW